MKGHLSEDEFGRVDLWICRRGGEMHFMAPKKEIFIPTQPSGIPANSDDLERCSEEKIGQVSFGKVG